MKNYNYEVSVSAVLISAIGIAQTVGMIGLGYLGDLPWMNINVCYSICMLGKFLSQLQDMGTYFEGAREALFKSKSSW